MNDGADGVSSVPVDDSCHMVVEVPVLVFRPGMLRALEYEFDHIVNRYVLGIPGSLTNVVKGLGIGHQYSLWGGRVSVRRR